MSNDAAHELMQSIISVLGYGDTVIPTGVDTGVSFPGVTKAMPLKVIEETLENYNPTLASEWKEIQDANDALTEAVDSSLEEQKEKLVNFCTAIFRKDLEESKAVSETAQEIHNFTTEINNLFQN